MILSLFFFLLLKSFQFRTYKTIKSFFCIVLFILDFTSLECCMKERLFKFIDLTKIVISHFSLNLPKFCRGLPKFVVLSELHHVSLEASKQQVQIYCWHIELRNWLKIYKLGEIVSLIQFLKMLANSRDRASSNLKFKKLSEQNSFLNAILCIYL